MASMGSTLHKKPTCCHHSCKSSSLGSAHLQNRGTQKVACGVLWGPGHSVQALRMPERHALVLPCKGMTTCHTPLTTSSYSTTMNLPLLHMNDNGVRGRW